jgi:hypothetical protein
MKDWPAAEDSIYKSDGDMRHDALLTIFSGFDSILHYAQSFKDAADTVVVSVEQGQRSADSVGLAVCFLYRHYVEMMLKGLICLLSGRPDYPKHHRVADLWKESKPLLETVFPEGEKSAIDAVAVVINEIAKLDPCGEAFRFGLKKSGEPTLSERIEISLTNLRDVMNGLDGFLSGSYDAAGESRQFDADIELEIQEWL